MKTLAIRLEDEEHALLVLMARVNDRPLAEELRAAVAAHVEQTRSAPDFAERAKGILDEIDREAQARRSAINALFESSEGAPAEAPEEAQPRRGNGRTRKS